LREQSEGALLCSLVFGQKRGGRPVLVCFWVGEVSGGFGGEEDGAVVVWR